MASFTVDPMKPIVGETVTLNASGSSDSDGSITSYAWDLNGDGFYGDATGEEVTTSFFAGDKKVGLEVTDNDSATSTTNRTISVNARPTADVTVSPPSPLAGETVTLNASDSSDPDGSITSYEWDLDNDGTFEESGEEVTTSFDSAGDKTVVLRVTDNDSANATATETITVEKPSVSLAGVDATDFPTVRAFVNINTLAGRSGNLTADNFTVREDGTEQSINSVTFTAENATEQSKVDIVFVFDDTGSMGGEIGGMQDAVKEFTDRVNDSRDARFALVSFKDDVELDQGFTSNATKLKNAVDALRASGGNDFPEDNLDALNLSMSLPTRSDAQKVLVDITDARTHYRGDGDGISNFTMPEIERKIESQGYTYIAVAPDAFLSEPVEETSPTDDEKQVLANATNGLWIDIAEASTAGEFEEIINEIGERISTTWIIEYESTDAFRSGLSRTVNVSVDDPSGTETDEGGYIAPSMADELNILDVDSTNFPTINVSLTVDTAAGTSGSLTMDNFSVSEEDTGQSIRALTYDSDNETWFLEYVSPDTRRDGTLRGVSVDVNESVGNGTVLGEYIAPGDPDNERPTANFSISDRTPDVNQTITLNASNSTDSDGTIESYRWDLDGDGDYDDDTGKTLMTNFSSAGNQTIGLMVVDNASARDTNRQTIRVLEPGESVSGGQPGFGIAVAVVALIAVVLFARRRQ